MTTLLLGTRKGLIFLNRSGDSFEFVRDAHLGVPVVYAFRDSRTGTIWASLDHGHWGVKLSRSNDEGVTWEEVAAPTYPQGCIVSDGVPATNKYMWVMSAGGPDQPGRLYIGTEPGGLFVSDDGGDTWELNQALWSMEEREKWFGGGRDDAGIHSILIDPRDSNHISVGVSCAGVIQSTDGGQSWIYTTKGLRADFLPNPESPVGQDPHLIAHCESNPDIVWQQNHCGIWRSIDGGQSWDEVSEEDGPASFGFAVVADPCDAECAWVVPAENDEIRVAYKRAMCVSRTDDGGKTWKHFREGLPQHCYDITYRHALDLSGDCLVFGTTTGNVYASYNRGETWSTLGNNYPLVHSVRFA
jgi:photosystem II stability/assembly factor-like uncharacterized protein